MRTTSYAVVTIVTAALGALPGTATAQAAAAAQATDPQTLRREIDQLRSDFEAVRQEYGQRLSTLEGRLAAIQDGQPAAPGTSPGAAAGQTTPQAPASPLVQTAQVPPGAEGAGGPSGALPVYGGAAAGSKIFNPDIAVIGDFLGAAGHNRRRPSSGARAARVGSVVPGGRRSLCARRFLHLVRRGRRGARGGLPDVHRRCPADC